ncbi:MAG TPA: hypothetical protein VLZ89_08210 [Anaerolineales bacterium]|nr:hypothetical protein [Anaerolineales bacterium]
MGGQALIQAAAAQSVLLTTQAATPRAGPALTEVLLDDKEVQGVAGDLELTKDQQKMLINVLFARTLPEYMGFVRKMLAIQAKQDEQLWKALEEFYKELHDQLHPHVKARRPDVQQSDSWKVDKDADLEGKSIGWR